MSSGSEADEMLLQAHLPLKVGASQTLGWRREPAWKPTLFLTGNKEVL